MDASKKYLIFLILFMIVNDIFDSYTTNLPNMIGSLVIKEFGIGESAFAFVTAIASIGTFFALINQFLADFVGRRKMLFVVLFGTGFAALLLGISPTIELYMIFLFILYINFNSDIWTITINEESPKDKRGYYTNIILIFGVTGSFLVILFRETLFYAYGWRSLTWFAILAMPLAFLSFLFKESKKFQEFNQLKLKEKESLKFKLKKISKHENRTGFLTIFIVSFLVGLNYIIYAFGEPYFSINKGFSHSNVSLIMTMMGLGAVLGYSMNAYLLDHLGRKTTVYFYLISIFILILLILFGDFTLVLICSLMFSAFFWGLFSALKIMCIELFPTDIRGVGIGLRSFYFSLGFTVGSLLSAVLIPYLSLGGVFLIFTVLYLINIPLIFLFIKETKGIELEII